MRSLRLLVVVCLLTSLASLPMLAQNSGVTGTVFDKSGAAVPKANLELKDLSTNAVLTATSGDVGQFTFVNVAPGKYKLTVTAQGFRQYVLANLKVEVATTATVNPVLEIGTVTQVVEVQAGAGVELQTVNTTVGNVMDSNKLASIPSLSRDAATLILLQPMAIPGFNPGTPQLASYGEGNTNGGTIAGARMDQNTFMIDGGDATSNMEGGGGYNTGFSATPRAVVPTPVESLEEFRVETNNQGVDFSRSAGAAVQMVTRRGTNAWHGSGYWYLQQKVLNANDWFRNQRGPIGGPGCPPPAESCQRPLWRDTRAGGSIGGPIWKNRTFFYLHEEERHFKTADLFQRLVPSAAMRVGILKFRDSGGTVRAYNLNPVATMDVSACGAPCALDNDPLIGTTLPADNGTLDPRMIGLNPAIAQEFAHLPAGNDFNAGDAALRTPKFTAFESNLANEHFAVARIDHKISDKWDFMGSMRFGRTANIPPNKQTDIGGVAAGCTLGVACNISTRPLQPRFVVASLIGRLTPNLNNEFHFNYLRHWWSWIAPGARIPVPGLNTGTNCTIGGVASLCSDTRLQIWSESRTSGMVPINVDTQNARERTWNGQDYTFSDNISWLKGKHAFSFGGRAQIEHFLHIRDDKVVGGITTPLYYAVRGGQFLDITVGIPIARCSATVTTNCIKNSDRSTYRRALISTLGMIDSATQVLTRAGDLSPNPAGTRIIQKENVDAYEIHFGDTWRALPSLTVSYGLSWGIAMPPFDPTGKTSMMVDASSGAPLVASQYFSAKQQAALNGIPFNPTVGIVPIKATGRKYPFDPDYTNFGPKVGVAWNPSFTDGPLGMIFGNKQTVLRGGWSRVFERKNGVGLVLTPALGIGFGDLAECVAPLSPITAAGGCNGAVGSTTTTAFRIGVDGSHINIPSLPVVPSGVIIPGQGATFAPSNATSVFEGRDFRLDPRFQTGSSDEFDFTFQRELPGNMILEAGWTGKISRDLFGNLDLNSIPYMFTPKNPALFGALATNQSFAQAFDAVAAQLQATGDPTMVTTQPFFEAMLGGPTSAFCMANAPVAGGSCTSAAAVFDGLSFWQAHGAGAVWNELEAASAFCPQGLSPTGVCGTATTPAPLTTTFANTQFTSADTSGSFTHGNYNAAFVSLRSRGYHGLVYDLSYTYSHSLDNFGTVQECTGALPDAYALNRSYAPSLFDRRHAFNLLLTYELPFGKGKTWATSNNILDKIIGGWNVSSIYTIATGLPDMVYDSAACGTEFGTTASNGNVQGLLATTGGVINMVRVNNPTLSGSGYGNGSAPPTGATHGIPNMFQNPDIIGCVTAALQGCTGSHFRYATFADKTLGFGQIRGPLRWNIDMGVAKTTTITERVKVRFDAQFINAFNHPMFGTDLANCFNFSNQPCSDISTPGVLGVPANQFNLPRYIQFGLKVEF